MDFDAAMMRPIGLPALARCALDGTLRTSTSNRCSLSCSSRCFQRCPACSCSWNTATTRSGRWWRLHYNISCTRLVKWTPRVPASPALPALPHTQYTHTQSHNRRHGSRLGAGRRGWDAAEQRSRGRLAAVAGPVGARGGRRGWKHRRQSAPRIRHPVIPAGRRKEARTARAFLAGARGRLSPVRRNTGGWQQLRRDWARGRGTRRGPTATTDGGDRRRRRRRRRPQMRPGLFSQREGPGSEPGNSLVRPDDRGLRVRS